MIPLETCFGYPLKLAAYSLIVAELVIGAFSILGYFRIADNVVFNIIECLATVFISILGLYGIQKDNFVYITGYTGLQLILLLIVFFELVAAVACSEPIRRIISDIIITATMSFALIVTASYRLEMQGGIASSCDGYPSML